MEVDYVLFHEDKHKVETLYGRLGVNGIFLLRGYWRWKHGYFVGGDGLPFEHMQSWDGSMRKLERLGANVIGWSVTIDTPEEYPEVVAAVLVEQGWLVRARWRTRGGAWSYAPCAFPEGCAYTQPW